METRASWEPSYRPWPIAHLSHIPVHEVWAYPEVFYNYKKLESASSFRLLKLEKISKSEDKGHYYSIVHTNLDEAPPYEALSYVWGTNDRDVPISLSHGKLLRVTRPLKEALSRIEKHSKTGYLWIDQICIDQDDLTERGHQVKIMGHIYSSCSRVIVWLGILPHTRRVTQESLSKASGRILGFFQRSKPSQLETRKTERLHSRNGSTSTLDEEYDERLACLNCSWFQRAWVFQEIVLPPEAIFVLELKSTQKVLTMSLPILYQTISRERKSWNIVEVNLSIASSMYERWDERRQKSDSSNAPIEETLSLMTPRAQTSEQLDRLYAFFGLNLDPSIDLQPSYNLSIEEAIIATTFSIIKGTCRLDILEHVPRVSKSLSLEKSSLPSFVPNLQREQLVTPFPRSPIHFDRFLKDEDMPFDEPFQLTPGSAPTMQINVWILDYLEVELDTLSVETMDEKYIRSLLNRCEQVWQQRKRWHQKREPDQDSYTITDRPALKLDFAPQPTVATLLLALFGGVFDSGVLPTLDLAATLTLFRIELSKFMHGRSLWMTRLGRLALGSYLRRKDEILIAYGCSNPLVLRGRKDDFYTVVSTCYLDEWMDPWSNGKIVAVNEHCGYTSRYLK